ncbi:MAG: GFA family protein [Pseudomonadota bacterium]
MPEFDQRTPLHTGGCQCGAVRFAFYAAPLRVSLCHCRMCQRAVSGPFGILVECANSEFAWTKGTQKVFQSSSRAERGFCRDCGSPLSYRVIDSEIIELYLCAFDEPAQLAPEYAVGDESKLPWTDGLSSLPSRASTEIPDLKSYQS